MNYNELNLTERKEIDSIIANWLRPYTHAVIINVLAKRDEILNNEFAMNLLKELKQRDEHEAREFENDIGWLLRDYDNSKQFDPHNHALTHAGSYRDILYDMYIKD